MTKEPKLDRARRILSEWESLDLEVKSVRDTFHENEKGNEPVNNQVTEPLIEIKHDEL